MTPAPISVERLRATVVFNRDVQSPFPHMETDPEGQYVRHSDYAALLQQLAELQAKTACTLGVGDGSGQLFVHGDYESIKAAQGIIDKLAEREAELSALRQACWDARAVLGFDNDGNSTPAALAHPSLAELVKRDAAEFRKDYDEACAEVCAEFEKRVAAERAREEAAGLLREVLMWRRTVPPIAETPRKDGGIFGRIAAFLAASGGANES